MKVKNYNYQTFPSFDEEVEGIVELKGEKGNLRCRLLDVEYQKDCIIRFLFPDNMLNENKKYPLIMHVQGSGWYHQNMNDHIFDFMPIVKKGFAYAIIQYNSAPKYKFPRQVIDTKKAIRFIIQHKEEYPIDTSNLFLSGDSSGAHTALLTLFTYNQETFDEQKSRLPKLKGCIDLYGSTNFLKLNDWYSKYDWFEERNTPDLMGEDHMDEESLLKASPIYYVDSISSIPPLLILHGSKDHVIPFTQSVDLYYALKNKKCEVTFARVKDADHGRSIFYVEDVYNCIVEFLKKHCNN